MNQKEYETEKNKYPTNNETTTDKPVADGMKTTEKQLQKTIEESKKMQTEIQQEIQQEETRLEDIDSNLENVQELSQFMQTEEFLRLGTKARIPIPLDLNGYKVKVYIRALSSHEMEETRLEAKDKGEDVNYLAALKVCTDSNGNPYPREVLDQLGYARVRDIGEGIAIASGESADVTSQAITKKVIDNFLQG